MDLATTKEELQSARSKLPDPVGFVPTMGYLHAGHISLVRQAKMECASVITSIFVNPTQFGPQEDFTAYPRDLEHDLNLLQEAGCDLVWTPTPAVLYPPGYQTWVDLDKISLPLEGAMRPGHFRGVATIVAKLFNCTLPARAYFGQKDAQQVAVIRQMVKDLDFPIEIIACPTLREPDGLAMSSRNVYLDAEQRQAATVLYRALQAAKGFYTAVPSPEAEHLRKTMRAELALEPLAKAQYVSCADPDSLLELEGVVEQCLCSMAVYIGKTRLIDNCILSRKNN